MDQRKVFISYASRDSRWAEWLGQRLAGRGFEIWTDATSVPVGESFMTELNRTIGKSDLVVALLSPSYFRSQWCQQETAMAAANRVPIIPVVVEPCEVTGFLQYYNLGDLTSDRDRGLNTVIQAAEHLLQPTA